MDDCWSDGRFENGTLRPNATRFPNGIGYVADKVHAQGYKWGMYSSAGRYTCAQYEASLGRETEDANTFASWGVDYLKYDNCFNQGQEGTSKLSFDRYKIMSDALNHTGRPIFYSLCNWGTDYPWDWGQTIANSWRATGDIYDSFDRADPRCPCETWDCALPGFHCSVMNILNKAAPIVDKGRPGGWNDLDSLEVGNSGMSEDEYILHFTMWYVPSSTRSVKTYLTFQVSTQVPPNHGQRSHPPGRFYPLYPLQPRHHRHKPGSDGQLRLPCLATPSNIPAERLRLRCALCTG